MSTGRPDRYQLCGRGRDADEVKFCIDPVWPTSRYRRQSPKRWVRYKTRRCGDQPTVRAAWRSGPVRLGEDWSGRTSYTDGVAQHTANCSAKRTFKAAVE